MELVQATLDQRARVIRVTNCVGRDVADCDVSELREFFENWYVESSKIASVICGHVGRQAPSRGCCVQGSTECCCYLGDHRVQQADTVIAHIDTQLNSASTAAQAQTTNDAAATKSVWFTGHP